MSRLSNWRTALSALRQLLKNRRDTTQVFRIMRALNTNTAEKGYARLLQSQGGGRIAYRRVELADRLSDDTFVERFPDGSVGAAYAAFARKTGYSIGELAALSRKDDEFRDVEHPWAWFGRRMRDSHDIWHVLTGYPADEPPGEACLIAFTYAQTKGPGWALIMLAALFKALSTPGARPAFRAILEGYRRGKAAAWLLGEDYEQLLLEPLSEARKRLRLPAPVHYRSLDLPLALDMAR